MTASAFPDEELNPNILPALSVLRGNVRVAESSLSNNLTALEFSSSASDIIVIKVSNSVFSLDISNAPDINITKSDGSVVPLDVERLATLISDACQDLDEVSVNEVLDEALKNLYDGVSIADMRTSLVMSARTKVEKEPNYSFVTARILMDQIRNEALNFLNVAEESTYHEMESNYPKAFKAYIDKGLSLIHI